MEKFKDVFPDPNIEAALIAMDDFACNAKESKNNWSTFINQHMTVPWHPLLYLFIQSKIQPQKVNRLSLKVISINWPLLINLKHKKTLTQGIQNIMGDNPAEAVEITEAPVAGAMAEIQIIDMITRTADVAEVKDNVILIIVEGVDKITHIEDDDDSGMEMTRITVTETIKIENSDSQGNSNRDRRWDNNNRGQGHSDRGRGR